MDSCTRRKLSQFDVHSQLYRSSTSLVVHATDRVSHAEVALKLYLKSKLVTLTRCVPTFDHDRALILSALAWNAG